MQHIKKRKLHINRIDYAQSGDQFGFGYHGEIIPIVYMDGQHGFPSS
jgi:hypothetical protein